MKPDALYELSSVFSFFLRENGIEAVNMRYFGFFHKDYDKKNQFSKLLGFVKSDKFSNNKDIISFPWKNVSLEELNFCLSRLSRCLSNKEKLIVLLLLLDLCHDNCTFIKKRTDYLETIARKLVIDLSWLANLKKLLIIADSGLNETVIDGNILLIRDSEFYLWKTPLNSHPDNISIPALFYIYLEEEMLAFVKVFDKKAKLNGYPLEYSKIYPMSEGDVLYSNNKLMSFNGLFRYYFNCSQFAPLKIAGTDTTPEVNFDSRKNNLEISGCSVPENGMAFYSKLNNWLDNYLITNPNNIKVNIRLDYFNTTSSKCILDFLFRLQSYKTENIELQINWFFQDGDEDLEEAGLNYSEIIKIPFALIPYN